jgi:hypothetical protein
LRSVLDDSEADAARSRPAGFVSRADFDVVELKTLPRRSSPLPDGERSDRACAIRVRGIRPESGLRSPLTRNVRAKRAHSDLSPTERGRSVGKRAQPLQR